MMEIDIVGEDPVTQAIIERLIADFRKDISIRLRLPARGGQLKALAPKYNLLDSPLFLLTDLDTYACAPALIQDWLQNKAVNNSFLFRVAQEEAETWIMADRDGFSEWLGVKKELIPEPKFVDKKKKVFEIVCPMKPSLFMMLKIVAHSPKQKLKDDLTPKKGAGKGPAYNTALLPFIEKKWDIANARKNSSSLNKAIIRLTEFKQEPKI